MGQAEIFNPLEFTVLNAIIVIATIIQSRKETRLKLAIAQFILSSLMFNSFRSLNDPYGARFVSTLVFLFVIISFLFERKLN